MVRPMIMKERLESFRPYVPPVMVRRQDAISALEAVPRLAVSVHLPFEVAS